eukprot:gene14532-19511_t
MDSRDSSIVTDLVVYNASLPFVEKLTLPERLYSLVDDSDNNGKENIIRIKQNYISDGKGGTKIGFGASLYDCSLVMIEYLRMNSSVLKNKSVLEVGCGTGSKYVVATDGGEESVALSSTNILNNCENHETNDSIIAAKLYWGDEIDTKNIKSLIANHRKVNSDETINSSFDVILACDVVAVPYEESYSKLVETFLEFADERTIIYFADGMQQKEFSFVLWNNILQWKGTEDPFALKAAIEYTKEHNWTMFYTNVFDQLSVSASGQTQAGLYNPNEYLSMLLNLDLSLDCLSWVCTLQCRIIDELRATIANKANLAQIDLNVRHNWWD